MRDSTGDTRNAGVRCLRISPDGQTLATGDRSGNVRFAFKFLSHASLCVPDFKGRLKFNLIDSILIKIVSV